MEFLNNTRNFGLIMMIISVIDLVVGIMTIVKSFNIYGVGMILSSIVMILAGIAIFSQTDGGIISFAFPEGSSSKFGALTGYIFATGLATIVSLHPVSIVIGIIIMIIGWIITNDKKTFIDSIIWVLLVIIFALMVIGNILAVFSGDLFVIASGVLGALLSLMAFLYLLDSDVKKKLIA